MLRDLLILSHFILMKILGGGWHFFLFYRQGSFPGGSEDKESTPNAGDLGFIPGLGRSPGGGHGNPLQYFCVENLHGQKSVVGLQSVGSQRVGHD